jgi:uncharacterized membrane protein YbhN (UPF0104 family)
MIVKQCLSSYKKTIVGIAKVLLAVAVIVGAGRQLATDLTQVKAHQLHISLWLMALSALLYVGGISLFGLFWVKATRDMGGKLGSAAGLVAYATSQPGKYVPGKAWVLVIRCGLASRFGVPAALAVVSTFYETLSIMAFGSAISLISLQVSGSDARLRILALGLMLGFGTLVQPPVFRRLVHLVALPFRTKGDEVAKPIGYGTFVWACALLVPGWIMMGASLDVAAGACGFWPGLSYSTGAASLGLVGGFAVVFVPAGLGAREWLVVQALGPAIGTQGGSLAAVISRVIGVGTELIVAGVLYVVTARRRMNQVEETDGSKPIPG